MSLLSSLPPTRPASSAALKGPRYLPRIIEIAEHELRESGPLSAAELAGRVGGRLERSDNLDIYLHQRAGKL